MTIGGANVPLSFVSPGQINFQVPYFSINALTPAYLIITEGTLTTAITVTVTPYAPGLYTTNSQGTGQAAAIIANTATLVAPSGAFPGSRPAQTGEFVSLYCTGLGAVRNRPELGSPSPSSTLATTIATPVVTVGGVNASVSFSGLAPGYVGLYQVNIQVPVGVPSGDAVPVTLNIGGVAANIVTIAVQ
jgi:minor extracellular serine protease Vpr